MRRRSTDNGERELTDIDWALIIGASGLADESFKPQLTKYTEDQRAIALVRLAQEGYLELYTLPGNARVAPVLTARGVNVFNGFFTRFGFAPIKVEPAPEGWTKKVV